MSTLSRKYVNDLQDKPSRFSGGISYRPAVKRGCRPEKLEEAIALLCEGKTLLEEFRDHQLLDPRSCKSMRECNIEPDGPLICRIAAGRLIRGLIRAAAHSDLF